MQRVGLKKLNSVNDPKFPTALENEYVAGQLNDGVSPPIDYEIEGFLLSPISLNEFIIIQREKRNGVAVQGLFKSSRIAKIKNDIIHTQNSIYRITFL